MKIGISTSEHLFNGDLDAMFSTLHNAGYGSVDYIGVNVGQLSAAEEQSYCKKLRETAARYDIEIGQTHADAITNHPEEEFLGDEFAKRVIAGIERTARLDCRYCVVHPYAPQGLDFFINQRPFDYSEVAEHNKELNLEFYSKFLPVLKRTGVMICIENLFTYDVLLQRHVFSVCSDPHETLYYIDQLGKDYFGACYDSGHLNHFGGDEEVFVETLGDNLKCTHFNDSWGKEFHGMDWHLMPGQGDVDWMKISRSLKEIGYKGVANFEIIPRAGLWYKPQLNYIFETGNLIFNGSND